MCCQQIHKKTMYQTFIGAVEVNKDQISQNFTKVLVLGCLNLIGSLSQPHFGQVWG